jgi:hypothetical protein
MGHTVEDDLPAMTEPELYDAMHDALHAECKAIASELATFGHGVPDDVEFAVRIENARQRWSVIERELRRRS